MAQSVRCFLCKHEDLGSTSRTQEKKPDVVAHTCNLSAEEAEIAGSWGTQAKQHRLIYEFQAKWQTLSQKVRWGRGPKKHVRSLHTYEHMYTHPHKRTQKHPPWMKVRRGHYVTGRNWQQGESQAAKNLGKALILESSNPTISGRNTAKPSEKYLCEGQVLILPQDHISAQKCF